MKNKLDKPFICEGEESWSCSSRSAKGMSVIDPESMEISISIFKGTQPYFLGIINFILRDKDIRMLILMYQQKGRKKLFSMR